MSRTVYLNTFSVCGIKHILYYNNNNNNNNNACISYEAISDQKHPKIEILETPLLNPQKTVDANQSRQADSTQFI